MARVPGWALGFKLALAGVFFWDPPARAIEAEAQLEARGSPAGEGSARVLGSLHLGTSAVRLGAESAAGSVAPLRHALLAGASTTLGDLELDADARAAPEQAGAAGLAGSLALRRDFSGVALGAAVDARRSRWAPCAACPQRSLSGIGAALEVGIRLPWQLRGSLRGAAFRVELRGFLEDKPASEMRGTARSTAAPRPGPWDRYGASTLDWAQTWDVTARLERTAGSWSVAATGSLGAPAQVPALCQRASLTIQRELGRATLGVGAGVLHLAATGQTLAEGTLAIGVRLGGVP